MHQLKEIHNLHASKNSQNRQKPVMLTLAHSSSCMHHHSQPVCATQAKHTDVRTLVLHLAGPTPCSMGHRIQACSFPRSTVGQMGHRDLLVHPMCSGHKSLCW